MAAKRGKPAGLPKSGGRKKGTPNKVTKAVKEAVAEALNSDGGAVEFFRKLKNSSSAEDRRCFAQVCARLIPTELVGDKTRPLFVNVLRLTND